MKIIWGIGLVGIIIGIVLLAQFTITGRATSTENTLETLESPQETRTARFRFEDQRTGCLLNGNVILNGQSLGETKNGIISITEDNIVQLSDQSHLVVLEGITDECFNEDAGLKYHSVWTVDNLGYYFTYNESAPFIQEINPRYPVAPEYAQQFIRPEETREHLSTLNLKSKARAQAIDTILSYSFRYRNDTLRDKWQTPAETLEIGRGDCEDWANLALSMFKEYDKDIACYVVVWDTHASIICHEDNTYTIHDQRDFKRTLVSENPTNDEINSFINNYFRDYGLDDNINARYVYSTDTTRIFGNQAEFIEWLSSLN